MPFLLDGDPTPGEISEAINYLLNNFSQNVSSDPSTGQIIGPDGNVVGYLYKYMFIKYADSFDGTVGFSNTPTNKAYYGLRNSDSSTESTNPADYLWTQVTGGFGTTKSLYYLTTGGRSIQFQVSTTVPNPGWAVDPGTAIDLDFVTGASSSPANFVVIRVTNVSTAPTDAEVLSAIGRLPISGDLCTINYNSGISSIVYKYTTGWAVFQKYITGDLIVAQSIVGGNIAASTITGSKIAAQTITASNMVTGTITAASGIIANAAILSANIGTAEVTTLNIQNEAVIIPSGATSSGSGASVTMSLTAGNRVLITAFVGGSSYNNTTTRTSSIRVNSSVIASVTSVNAYDGLANAYIPVPINAIYTVPTTASYTFDCVYNQSNGTTAIQVLGIKR